MEVPTPETSVRLPGVSNETGEAFLADLNKQGMPEFMRQAQERLLVDNPALFRTIVGAEPSMGLRNPHERGVSVRSMVLTHELLRRQAEADAARA